MKNEIFEANPNLDLYYETADGEAFFSDNAASNHAKGLKSKAIKTLYRSDFEDSEELEEFDYEELDENGREDFWKNVMGTTVHAETTLSTNTVVNTDPFDPTTFPNRVLTTNTVAPAAPVAPIVSTEPKEPVEPTEPKNEPVTEPANEAIASVAPAEPTKAVEAKTTKK